MEVDTWNRKLPSLYCLSERNQLKFVWSRYSIYHFGIFWGLMRWWEEVQRIKHAVIHLIYFQTNIIDSFFVLLFLCLKQSWFLTFITKNITPKGMTVASKKRGSRYLFIIKQRETDDLLLGNFHTIRHSTQTNLRVTKELSYSSLQSGDYEL